MNDDALNLFQPRQGTQENVRQIARDALLMLFIYAT